MLILILFLFFCTALLFGFAIFPSIFNKATLASQQRQQKFSHNMEELMSKQDVSKWNKIFLMAPLAFAAILFTMLPEQLRVLGAIGGAVGGFALPGTMIPFMKRRRRDKFEDQLVDALMIMSSSFRGGLSLVQALEAVVEEMPDPINKEFGTVLGENKMGVTLEEALNHLYHRMPSVALQQMTTAILLARETGGNLPVIFSRIVNNIRETKKIRQNLATLTVQGKIQGVVLTILPIVFAAILYSANRRVFEHMLESQTGKTLLIVATFMWLIGAYLIIKISTIKEF